jgi:hypothetical protein
MYTIVCHVAVLRMAVLCLQTRLPRHEVALIGINRPTDIYQMQPRNVGNRAAIMRLITVSACITIAVVLLSCGMAQPNLAAADTAMRPLWAAARLA